MLDLFPTLGPEAPDRPALTFPDRALTHRELRDAAGAVAARVGGRERVAILAEPRIETAVAVIGALAAGAAVVPINPRSGSGELGHIAQDARPEALLLAPDAEAPGALADPPALEIDLDLDLDELPGSSGASSGAPATDEPDPEQPALIVYTSGTTGPPKGAVLPRRAIASNLDALASVWAWTESDVVVHGLPLFHVHGLVLGILGPVRRGGAAVHVGRFTPQAIGSALQGGATMVFGVPTMYRRLADEAESSPELAEALGGARLLVSGSAALPAAEHERIEQLTGRGVVERYGMTETLMNTAMHADEEPRPGAVGRPLPGVGLRVLDDDGREVEPGSDEIGEVRVRGPNLFLGYLNQVQATAEAMDGDWFLTGDLATLDPDGHVRLVGRRATDLIKSGGYKIGAGEVEGALREHPAVEDAAVTGEPDEDLGERVVAWVVRGDGEEAGEQELIDHVASLLAPHKRPRAVRFVDELPRNEMGKVVKKRLGEG